MSARVEGSATRLRDSAEEQRLVDQLRVYQLEKLEKYRAKGHWRAQSADELLEHLLSEFLELDEAIAERRAPEDIAREAADVANLAAMIADVVLAGNDKGSADAGGAGKEG